MAKKISMNPQQEDPDFHELYKQQPEEIRNMLDEFGISSFEDLVGLSAMMGIDLDKLEKFAKEHGDEAVPSVEDVVFDEDNPDGRFYRMLRSRYEDDDEDDDDDPFHLPEKVFLNDVKVQEFHFRIKLNNAPVPVWREVLVPSNISLEFFAFVIIEAMGWENTHLHQFKRKDIIYKNRVCIKEDQKTLLFMPSRFMLVATEDISLSKVFLEKGDRLTFEYDFGDGWLHDVRLKGVRDYAEDEMPGLFALKGKGSCPPEDCGGVWGYEELLRIYEKKRKTADEKERLQWYGLDRHFDPNTHYPEFAQEALDSLWDYAMDRE